MMKIKIRTANNMREVQQAYDLAARIFGSDYQKARKRKEHILKTDKLNQPKDVVIALGKEKIIGMVRIVERKNYFLGQLLKNAGITSVCVLPSYQGRGIGKGLVNTAITVMTKKNYSLSLVVARRAVDGFYAKYGYVGTGLFTQLLISYDASKDRVIKGKYKPHFKTGFQNRYSRKYAEMYKSNYNKVPLAFYRPRKWWEDFEQNVKYKIKKNNFVNVMDKKNLIGYFIYLDGKVIEAACTVKKNIKFCNAILRYVFEKGLKRLLTTISKKHHCYEYYMNLNNTIEIRRVWDGGHMVRIIDIDKVKNAIFRYINGECCEFSKKEIRKAKKRIGSIINNDTPKMHSGVANTILRIIREDANPVIKKIAQNIQHSWSLIDEF